MTNAQDIVSAFMRALEAKDFTGAASLLADDFYFSGSMSRSLGKDQFIKFFQELAAGIPNLTFHTHDVRDIEDNSEGDRVEASLQITGRQENAINLYMLSLPIIPQMGRSVSLSPEQWQFVVRNNLIAAIDAQPAAGAGIAELLHQLGVDAMMLG
ncbi:MAG TPA: nuclear transport factor 2 family protein [Ktedonobacteraceae bacterium]|nr:nuclear transport factor 2 family protein [Ktedonobacteraceae bacterium]